MASSSQKRHRNRKGKAPAEDHVVPPPPTTGFKILYFNTTNDDV